MPNTRQSANNANTIKEAHGPQIRQIRQLKRALRTRQNQTFRQVLKHKATAPIGGLPFPLALRTLI